jgi:rhamnosyltransferase
MKNKIKTSIIIRTHNHGKLLGRLLKKIKAQEKFEDYETIVIDSSSRDNTKEVAKRSGCRVISINPKDFSHAHTFNLGAERSKGEIILYASVDIIPKNKFWAYNLIKHFGDPKVAGAFSKQEPIKDFNLVEEFKMKKIFKKDGTTLANFSNASGAIRKNVWKKIKYDEKVPYQYIGGEDQQLIVEAKKKGYKTVYESKSTVYHSHKHSLKTNLYQAYIGGIHEREIKEWNKEVSMLNYSRKELIKFLIKRMAWKKIMGLFIQGALIRIYHQIGKIKGKSDLLIQRYKLNFGKRKK